MPVPQNLRLLIFAAVAMAAMAGSAPAQFNSWARCNNPRLAPDRRIDYCQHLLNSGGGPNSEITVLTVLGSLYRDLHQYDQAIASYSQALQYEALGVADRRETVISPGSSVALPTAGAIAAALAGRAEVYSLTGKSDLALADAAHMFQLLPDAATSYAERCRLRAILKSDFDKALADCTEALKLAPNDTQALGAAGYLQYQMGHLKEAGAYFDKVLAISPTLPGALYMRGVIRLKGGDAAGGNADIAAAKNANPIIADSFSDIGVRP